MTWITAANVIAEAGNPTPSALGFADATALSDHVTNFLIPAAQNFIEQYLQATYTDVTVPAGVKWVAMRLAAAGLMKIGIRKMGGLVRVGDWQVELARQDVFTPELQAELNPFKSKTGPVFYEQPTDSDQ
jgi:hypothetical protein